MAKTPTGFTARCQCGAVTGALDADRMPRSDMGRLLGKWLYTGHTVEPKFGNQWNALIEPCHCAQQEGKTS